MEKAEDRNSAQTVKKLMLEHYEHIAPVFFDTLFFPLAAMNFEYADIERVVREAQQKGDDMMALVKTACASDAMYEAMVTEYKRNFSNLLAGRYASTADHLLSYTKGEGAEDIDTDLHPSVPRRSPRAYAYITTRTVNSMARSVSMSSAPSPFV